MSGGDKSVATVVAVCGSESNCAMLVVTQLKAQPLQQHSHSHWSRVAWGSGWLGSLSLMLSLAASPPHFVRILLLLAAVPSCHSQRPCGHICD